MGADLAPAATAIPSRAGRPGGAGLKRPARVVLTRARCMHRLSARDHRTARAWGQRAEHSTRSRMSEIAWTSQFDEFPATIPAGPISSTRAPIRSRPQNSQPRRPDILDMRAPGAATGVYALECAMDELAVALKTDRCSYACNATRIATRAEISLHQQQLRECYRQGAAPLAGRSAILSPLDGDGHQLIGWHGHRDRRRCRCQPRSASCSLPTDTPSRLRGIGHRDGT